MAQLIDKSTLVAEIERLIEIANNNYAKFLGNRSAWAQQRDVYEKLLSFLDTLETKEAELDDEKIKDYIYAIPHAKTGIPNGWKLSWNEEDVIEIVKHFFELGLKTQKEQFE